MTKKKRIKGKWVPTRSRCGDRLAMFVPASLPSPIRLWTWAVVDVRPCHPYLNVSPQSSRAAAVELAADLNRGYGRRRYRVRRVVYELHLPGKGSPPNVPALPISKMASIIKL